MYGILGGLAIGAHRAYLFRDLSRANNAFIFGTAGISIASYHVCRYRYWKKREEIDRVLAMNELPGQDM